MKMIDVPIGDMVFMENLFEEREEVRETYYTRTSDTIYRHHGCIQGSSSLEDGDVPRYKNFSSEGFEYKLIGGIVVRPIEESRFINFGQSRREGT